MVGLIAEYHRHDPFVTKNHRDVDQLPLRRLSRYQLHRSLALLTAAVCRRGIEYAMRLRHA